MNSAQESKNELEAAIRYAENAISSAKTTIESLATHQEQTGREEALTKLVKELEEMNEKLAVDNSNLEKEVQRQQDLGQGYYDSMTTFKEDRDMLEKNVQYLRDENERLKREKEASSGPCGCQAYRDLEEKATMPVIPKAVAIAIFREGIQTGVLSACAEIEGKTIEIDENEYCGGFEVMFTKEIDLDDELDLDWMRDKCGDYSEDAVIDSLKGLCADKEFECRIHGVDDQEENKNEH